jgi:ketosteroid isomerase-like protein
MQRTGNVGTWVATLFFAGLIAGDARGQAAQQKRVPLPESKPKSESAEKSTGSLADYVGRYGTKEITVRDGGLYYQRIGGRGAILRAAGKDSFALNEDAKITFSRNSKGAVVEMSIDWVSHEDERLKRESLPGDKQPEAREPVRRRIPGEAADTSPNAQVIARTEGALDARTIEQIQAIMTHLLETIYVSPEIGHRLAGQLREKFEAGGYNEAITRTQLGELLTRDLREWGNDKHLSVRYDPAAGGANTILDPPAWEKQKAAMSPPGSAGAGPRPRAPEIDERTTAQLKQDNYHFRQAKTLNGNVGYIELAGFAPGDAARQKAAEAMAALAQCDAMIIDLRDCPGGSGELVNFLASYFFDASPRVLMNRYFRPTNERMESTTVADLPGKRMPDTDLYILAGPRTVSAGESFAYTLQQYGRAKVVGEKTAGAGYNNIVIPIGQGFGFSISVGRPEHPRSGKGWEAVGVQPDIAVSVASALEAAHKAALQKLISQTTDERRKKELTAALQELEHGPISVDGEQQVRKLEREWLDAYEQHDAVAMERILADEFTITYGNGQTQSKAQVVESVKTREKSASPPTKFATEAVQARIEGDTVVLTGHLVQKSDRGGETMTMQFSYADTYARRNGRWQVIASRLTRL